MDVADNGRVRGSRARIKSELNLLIGLEDREGSRRSSDLRLYLDQFARVLVVLTAALLADYMQPRRERERLCC